MGGAVLGRLVPVGMAGKTADRIAGLVFVQRTGRIDQHGACGQVIRRNQFAGRDGDIIAVARVDFAVGIGEQLRLGKKVPELYRFRAKGCEIEPFELTQDLQQSDPARRWRPHRTDAIIAIGAAQRLTFFRLVFSDIGRLHRRIARRVGGDVRRKSLGRVLPVHGCRSLCGKEAESLCQFGARNQCAHAARLSIVLVEGGAHQRVLPCAGDAAFQ